MSTAEFSKRAAIFVAVALVPVLIWLLFDVILIIIGANLVAILLQVGAEPFRWIKIPRPIALVLSGLVIICVFGGAGYLFGTGMASELQEVLRRAEEAESNITAALQGSGLGKLLLSHVNPSDFSIATVLGRVFSISANLLITVVVMVFAGIYLGAQPSLYRVGLSMLFPRKLRPSVNETIDDVAVALRLWLLGQMIEMAIIGVMSGFAVWLIGLPSPFALGVIAGVAEFVPYVGPILAAIPAVLVAVTLNLKAVLWTIGAYTLIHQAEGHLVMPIIQRQMVNIPPALMLFSIVTIGWAFGAIALIFAAPLTVIFFVGVAKLYVRDGLEEKISMPGEPE